MHRLIAPVRSFFTFTAFAAVTSGAAAQGSLAPPPGPPAPVFKTLDQVEARIPLVAGQPGVTIQAAGNMVINQPGSYYLTGHLTISAPGVTGISILASDVTLDLNGFTLTSTAAEGGDAISVNGDYKGLHIRNGSIAGGTTRTGSVFTPAGWNKGIEVSLGSNCRVSDMSIRKTRKAGINATSGRGVNTVERCSVEGSGAIGIVAPVVIDCSSVDNLADGIWLGDNYPGSVSNSVGTSAGTGYGIDATSGTATNCFGRSVSSWGLAAEVAINCQGVSGSGTGLRAKTATNSTGTSSGGTGLNADTASGCAGKSGSGVGLRADVASNCTGSSASGEFGLVCTGTASFCRGSRNGGVAVSAPIAIGCTSGGGTIISAQKHLGTP